MGSDGEGSHDKRRPVTLQIQLMDRRKISVQTELDLTVEEFKLVLANLTGVPSDEQWLVYMGRILKNPETLRTYELEPDQSIHFLCIGPSLASTSIGSMPRESTTTSLSETYELDASEIPPCFLNPYCIADIINDMPFLTRLAKDRVWADVLEYPNILHNVLLYWLYYRIDKLLAFSKAYVTDNIKANTEGYHKLKSMYEVPKVAFMYDVEFGIPHGAEENDQLLLGLLGLSLVDTSDSGPESSNANQSDSTPDSDPFSGPESSNANKSECAPNSDMPSASESSNANWSKTAPNTEPLPNPWAESSFRLRLWEQVTDITDQLPSPSYWQNFYGRTVDILVPIILSDAILLRHCEEQGKLVDRSYVALREAESSSQDQYDLASLNLVIDLDAYFRPIREKFHPLQIDGDCGSGASIDGSFNIAPFKAVSGELFASQLAEMEQMGFMDRRENLKALLYCWGDVKKAVERIILEKTDPEEGRWS